MASLRQAGGNLLGTVADTANTVSTVANTISGGVGILNNMVQHMKLKQAKQQAADMVNFDERLIEDSALDNVKREENIRNYIGNDEGKQKSYTEYCEKIRKALQVVDQKNSETE